MLLSCYIIDDEYHSIEILVKFINQTPGLELLGSATNPLQGIEDISSGNIPDLLFLDIDMPQLNGLSVAELIGPATDIIFATSYREHAPEAFEKNAVDYLLKPINYQRFLKAVTKVRVKRGGPISSHPFFFVKSNIKGKVNRITIEEIRYVENIGNYIYIHTEKEKITTYLTLAEILAKLPEFSFSRIHQSYIVNHAFIRSVEYGQVKLSTDLYIPIGGTYRAAFKLKIGQDTLISKRDQPAD